MRVQGREQIEGGLTKRSKAWLGSKARKRCTGGWGPGIWNCRGSFGPQASDVTWACPKVQGGQSHREALVSVTVTVGSKEGLAHPLYNID